MMMMTMSRRCEKTLTVTQLFSLSMGFNHLARTSLSGRIQTGRVHLCNFVVLTQWSHSQTLLSSQATGQTVIRDQS